MIGWIRRIVRSFEDSELPLGYFVLSFGFWVALRIVIEGVVFAFDPAEQAVHHGLFYLSLVLTLAIALAPFAGRSPLKVLKVMMPAFVMVLVAPILDGTVFRGTTRIDYLLVDGPRALLQRYLTFFGPLDAQGITLGMRVEIGIVLALCLVYVHALTRSLVRALFGTLAAWTVVFVHCAMISLPPALGRLFAFEIAVNPMLHFRIFPLLCAASIAWIAWAAAPGTFRIIARDARFLRLLHYVLLVLLGAAFARGRVAPDLDHVLASMLAAASVALVWIFSVMINNVFDLDADRINAPERPLPAGAIDLGSYRAIAWGVCGAALALAASVGGAASFLVGLFALAYFVYSAPPLRLKKRCFASKFVIGINSAAAFLVGFTTWDGPALEVPLVPFLVILIGFSLGAHVIDLKDVEGDQVTGLRNLSTMLGQRRAQWILGVSVAAAHVLAFYWLRTTWIGWVFLAGGLGQLLLITERPYSDAHVVAVQNGILAATVYYVWGL